MHIGFDFVVRNLPKGTNWLRFRAIELGFARPCQTPIINHFCPILLVLVHIYDSSQGWNSSDSHANNTCLATSANSLE